MSKRRGQIVNKNLNLIKYSGNYKHHVLANTIVNLFYQSENKYS